MRVGTTELLVVLAVVMIIFGPKQLPRLAKMIGKSRKAFEEGLRESEDREDS